MDEEIVKYLLFTAMSLLVWVFKSQSDKRYKEQVKDKSQLDQNTANILENAIRDEAEKTAFETYKATINGDKKKTDGLLSDIANGINSLNDKVQLSINSNQQQIHDLRLDIEKRLNK